MVFHSIQKKLTPNSRYTSCCKAPVPNCEILLQCRHVCYFYSILWLLIHCRLTSDIVVYLLSIFYRRLMTPTVNARIEEVKANLLKEYNFRIEAENAKRAAYNFRKRKDVYIPKVFDEFVTERILTMEFVSGVKITDVIIEAMQSIND